MIAFTILPPSAAFRRNPPQIAATRRELPHGDSRCVTIRSESYPFATIGSNLQPFAPVRGRLGAFGGESQKSQRFFKKAK